MEMLMQYVWNSRLLINPMIGTDGQSIEVIDPGIRNMSSGPDFFNAKVIIDGIKWVGNIEMHVRASDWHRHGHDGDPAYNNVILHVVADPDTTITLPDGREIPQVVMSDFYRYKRRFENALNTPGHQLACGSRLPLLNSLQRTEWIDCLGIERLQARSTYIIKSIKDSGGDLDFVAYVMLARALGFGINADAMEMTARSINPRFLMLQSDSSLQVEAMLIGQSGLLSSTPVDFYHSRLIDEYQFLSNKYQLSPLSPGMWKTGGLRPANAPMRRLALLAEFMRHGIVSSSRLTSIESADEARQLFDLTPGSYWHTHTSPGHTTTRSTCHLSSSSINLLVINVIVPLLYAHGEYLDRPALAERAINMLYDLPAEVNMPVQCFGECSIKADNAFTSQALLHLYREYCTRRRCLSCRWAHHLIARPILSGQPTQSF
ncbi:MAG: DUF2851 family protein [Muribaculaceae bacterium]|nr:DUF2851 family protein [Muribaculaceae bacterium]